MKKILGTASLTVALGLICASFSIGAGSAAAAAEWGYDDPRHDARKVVNVVHTTLDTNASGRYRVKVWGQEFIKNRTDMVRIFLDTRRRNTGPEYRLTWYLGKNPAEPVGKWGLTRTDSWDSEPINTVKCPTIRKRVAFGRDLITLSLPKRCVGRPKAIRWSGLVTEIKEVRNGFLYGYLEWFPKRYRFKNEWVG